MENFNKEKQALRILCSPLDWGLGHTTRCIPLIHKWLAAGHQVSVACSPLQKELLLKEFPHLPYFHLEGYQIHYGHSKVGTFVNLWLQVPKILMRIRFEHRWLKKHLRAHPADMIVSDNRYGFYAKGCRNIFITHQLSPIASMGKWVDRWLSKQICRLIEAFQECWIPDLAGPLTFSGQLSIPSKPLRIPTKSIGALSRFSPCMNAVSDSSYLLVILSGPEPQRTILENKILSELYQYPQEVVLVRGTTKKINIPIPPKIITCFDMADTATLQKLICGAHWVISRSGYTSILDFATLRPKVVFIPTPGQSEQCYLAQHLEALNMAPFVLQHQFSLQKAWQKAEDPKYQWPLILGDSNADLLAE